MSKAILLNNDFIKESDVSLPDRYDSINQHNLYLYVKSYLASLRNNSAKAKNRGEVSGGGKKPWSQKGGGRARAGSITSPVFVGGGVSHGPTNNRNYDIKVNKKQKRLALEYAINYKANLGKLYVVNSVSVPSAKTKDAFNVFKKINDKTVLFVVKDIDNSTFLAFRNLRDCYVIEENELNAYLVSVFRSVVIEQSVFDALISSNGGA